MTSKIKKKIVDVWNTDDLSGAQPEGEIPSKIYIKILEHLSAEGHDLDSRKPVRVAKALHMSAKKTRDIMSKMAHQLLLDESYDDDAWKEKEFKNISDHYSYYLNESKTEYVNTIYNLLKAGAVLRHEHLQWIGVFTYLKTPILYKKGDQMQFTETTQVKSTPKYVDNLMFLGKIAESLVGKKTIAVYGGIDLKKKAKKMRPMEVLYKDLFTSPKHAPTPTVN